MKRLLSILSLCFAVSLFAGCGGGQGGPSQNVAGGVARGTGTVVMKITIPSLAEVTRALQAYAKKTGRSVDRLIPTNTSKVHVSYSQIDAATGALGLTAFDQAVPAPDPTVPTVVTVTLPRFAAAFGNAVTVLAEDAGGVTVAANTITLNIESGSTTTNAEISLVPTADTMTITAAPAASVGFFGPNVTLTAHLLAAGVAAAAPNPATLTWTESPVTYGAKNVDGTYTIPALNVLLPGTDSVSVLYKEFGQTLAQSAAPLAVTIAAPTIGAPTALAIVRSDTTAVTTANLFDVGADGSTLFYDATQVINPPDAAAGWSRIAPPAAGFPQANDDADFDTAAAPTYAGAGSRMTFSSNNQWLVSNKAGTTLAGLAHGFVNRAVTAPPAVWTFTPAGGFTIVDIDARGSLDYVLEKNGAAYQVETLNTAGASQGISTVDVPGFAPTNMAVIVNGASTDYYLADAAKVVRVRVSAGTKTVTADFTNAAGSPINPVDIAASDDARLLFVLDKTGPAAGRILAFYTADGTVAPVVKNLTGSLIPASAGVAGSRMSAHANGIAPAFTGISIFVLDQAGAATQIETYLLQ
jgi:hypothetical protein